MQDDAPHQFAPIGGRVDHGHRPWIFLSHGFRPFFLGAAIYAVLAVLLWTIWISAQTWAGLPLTITISEPPHSWHAHEMIFGYGAAAVAGFLLTAIPNWTGATPLSGRPLAGLFALWVAGRFAMCMTAFVPAWLVAAIDLAFMPVLIYAAAQQLRLKPALRNVILIGVIALLAIANLVYHLEALAELRDGRMLGARFGLYALVLMITIIGGRVVPAFTRNALIRLDRHDGLPHSAAWLDGLCILSVVLLLIADLGARNDTAAAVIALAATGLHGLRLVWWRPFAILDDPIVWVMHLGYAWLVVGLALKALSGLTGLVGEVAALHAFGTGTVATMTLAIMTRASLGHTGRALSAPPLATAAYVLVSLAALLRVLAPAVMPDFYGQLMLAAGLAWVAAFGLFTLTFAPILIGPPQSQSHTT